MATYGVKDITVFDYQNEIRFAATEPNGTHVIVLVYNTFFRQWSNWEIQDNDSNNRIAAQTFDVSGGDPKEAHYILRQTGKIIRQSSTAFQDQAETSPVSNLDYKLEITLNNLSMAGLQAAQRLFDRDWETQLMIDGLSCLFA